MIGLVDCEALSRTSSFIPNLEIMKLYAYFKNEQMVRLLTDDSLLDTCSTIYVRKDREESAIPSQWLKDKKVIWGGRAFTRGRYIPLPEEIENSKPNYNVYNNYIKGVLPNVFDETLPEFKFLDYSFLRIHNGFAIQPKHIATEMPLLIYDNNIFKENYQDKFVIIQESNPNGVHYVHPLIITHPSQIEIFKQYNLVTLGNRLITTPIKIDINFATKDFPPFVAQHIDYFKKFKAGSIHFPTFPSSKLNRSIYTFFIFECLVNQMYYMVSRGIKPSVYHSWNPGGNIGEIINYFVDYTNTPKLWGKSFKRYITESKGGKKREKNLREFLKTYPQLTYLFGVSYLQLSLGGTWYGQFRN